MPRAHSKTYPDDVKKRMQREICIRLTEGETLTSICRSEDMPNRNTVAEWLVDDNEFCAKYDQAKIHQADTYADMIVDISTQYAPTEHGMAGVRIKALMWAAEKGNPRKFGAHQRIELAATFIPADKLIEIANKTDGFTALPQRDLKPADILAIADKK